MSILLPRRRFIQCAAALTASSTSLAWANAYPSRPIKIVCPMPPGGAADLAVRELAHQMQQSLGQPVVIDNRPGGAFTVAMNVVKTAPKDGYTIFNPAVAMLATQALFKQYDVFKDLIPILGTGEAANYLVCPANRPFKTVKEFIDYARANPGKLNYTSSGIGSLEHLAVLNLCQRYGITATHVPVKGGPDMVQLLLSGNADLACIVVPPVAQFVAEGRLRALVGLSEVRNAVLAQVPTYVEEKLDIPRLTQWGGIAAPVGTPREALAALEKAAATAAGSAEFKAKISGAGMTPLAMSSTDFAKQWKDDYVWIAKGADKVKPLIKQ